MSYVCDVCGYIYDPADAGTSMTRQLVIRTMVSLPEPLSKISPMTGSAPSAV